MLNIFLVFEWKMIRDYVFVLCISTIKPCWICNQTRTKANILPNANDAKFPCKIFKTKGKQKTGTKKTKQQRNSVSICLNKSHTLVSPAALQHFFYPCWIAFKSFLHPSSPETVRFSKGWNQSGVEREIGVSERNVFIAQTIHKNHE